MDHTPFRSYLKAAVCAAALAAAIGCSARGESPAQTTNSSGGRGNDGRGGDAVPVSTGVVNQRRVPVEIRMIGAAEASTIVAVRAQITGELTSVTFKEGDDVQKGQVLFTLDRRPMEAAMQQAQANLERDTAQAT